ncbi:hypothetical protein ACQR35_05420 [Pseudarthrobacter sp. J1738]|uniref:hypothetical protein n=1 Tax=unclassified Pseudarthrobacter TaxID=2647000 RepID=UPI003D2AC442
MTEAPMMHRLKPVAQKIGALLAASLLLSGCAGSTPAPQWTAGSGNNEAGASSSSPTPGASVASDGTQPSSGASNGTGSASPTPDTGATASAWKTFTDPDKKVSFDLPQEWIAQSGSPAAGTKQGAVKVEVKDQDGNPVAVLQTGLPTPKPAACKAANAKNYTVISSVPVDIPHSDAANTISPRVVFRVIQGYKFFGSYGITNLVGGAGSKACSLQNIVTGSESVGGVSFADTGELRALSPDEKVAPLKSFDTLNQAARFVNESSEFANVQRMLLSLKITN